MGAGDGVRGVQNFIGKGLTSFELPTSNQCVVIYRVKISVYNLEIDMLTE